MDLCTRTPCTMVSGPCFNTLMRSGTARATVAKYSHVNRVESSAARSIQFENLLDRARRIEITSSESRTRGQQPRLHAVRFRHFSPPVPRPTVHQLRGPLDDNITLWTVYNHSGVHPSFIHSFRAEAWLLPSESNGSPTAQLCWTI